MNPKERVDALVVNLQNCEAEALAILQDAGLYWARCGWANRLLDGLAGAQALAINNSGRIICGLGRAQRD